MCLAWLHPEKHRTVRKMNYLKQDLLHVHVISEFSFKNDLGLTIKLLKLLEIILLASDYSVYMWH